MVAGDTSTVFMSLYLAIKTVSFFTICESGIEVARIILVDEKLD
jgi:hypothetical protein